LPAWTGAYRTSSAIGLYDSLMLRIALGSDEESPTVAAIGRHLAEAGHAVDLLAAGEEWPEVGRIIGEAVVSGDADFGVVCCWTGTGVSMAANKVSGVRAALCNDPATAAGARRWNDANVLALSLRATTASVAGEILDAWLAGSADAEGHDTIARLESSSRQVQRRA
jgi:ribose 5-phosphate isomerase B